MTSRPVVLVTGGAVRIGEAISRRLAAGGYRVVVHARAHAAEAQALAAELDGVAVVEDLTAPDGPERLLRATFDATGDRLDALVNNAASFDRGPSESFSHAAWEAQLHLNLTVPFRLCQLAAAALRRGPRPGAIVNLLDISAVRPYRHTVSYSAAKAGLTAVTHGLAAEWGPGIRVNGVAPGAAMLPADEPPEVSARVLSRTPHGRETGGEAVAEAVWFLVAGPEAVTGTVLTVDGGRSARW